MPVSQEILLIDSSFPGQELGDDILEPQAASSLLYTLTELGARTLIIQVPILGLSAGGTVGEAEILYRFDEEFSILSRNIRNLFDGIRTGSVAPGDSARYVGELVDLSEKGKERLVSALVRRDREGIAVMERAAAFFGHVRRPGDLRVQLIRTYNPGAGEGPAAVLAEKDEYSRARPDRDGILRRIAPVLTVPAFLDGEAGEKELEHIIYGALKPRYNSLEIEYSNTPDSQPFDLRLMGFTDGWISYPRFLAAVLPDGTRRIIPLDRGAAVLFELPRSGEDFRRVSISDFLYYDEADRSLRRLLAEGESLGIYQGVEGEKRPDILYDYSLSLREELSSYSGVNEEMKLAWAETRRIYFESLDDFLYGPTEMNLVRAFEEIIAYESLRDNEIAGITEMRDSLIRAFVALRGKYNEVLEYRNKLESASAGSICILGRGSGLYSGTAERQPSDPFRFPHIIGDSVRSVLHMNNPTDAEASALLANSILTGRSIKPGEDRILLALSLLAVLIVCLLVMSGNPASTLGIGLVFTLLAGTGFSLVFVFSSFWLNPLVPSAACGTGVIISYFWALITGSRYNRRFRLAYGPFVSRSCLKSVIRAGSPLPSQTVTSRAAVVAIRNGDLAKRKEALEPLPVQTLEQRGLAADTRAYIAFAEKVSELVKKAGGTVTGIEGDIATVCFVSPLERVFLRGNRKTSPYEGNLHAKSTPALKAIGFIPEIAKRPECESWRFGLDLGNCSFAWTALQGYFALGGPVQKARILSRLTERYDARVVLSIAVREALPDIVVKKLALLKAKDGAEGEPFYRLLGSGE